MSERHWRFVRLIISGSDCDPEVVTAALNMEPDQTWRCGERASLMRPDGSVQQSERIHEKGGWSRRTSDRHLDQPLDRQLFLWVK